MVEFHIRSIPIPRIGKPDAPPGVDDDVVWAVQAAPRESICQHDWIGALLVGDDAVAVTFVRVESPVAPLRQAIGSIRVGPEFRTILPHGIVSHNPVVTDVRE